MSEDRVPLVHLTRDDFEIQSFRSGGPGGQHQNKTETGIRIIHHESGVRAESREERSQLQNKQIAFRKLAADPKFVLWLKMKSAGQVDIITQAQEYADREINTPDHLQVQVMQDGKWVDL